MGKKEAKYIVVTGGVLSGLGKGLFISSLGKLLQTKGYNITPIKIDPYLNVDAGTMNPIEHGEVYVLNDGAEVDMDLGNYERFLNKNLNRDSNITTGKIFDKVIKKERRGDYLGKTVQLIPHITDELKKSYKKVAEDSEADIILIEIGGTVGDIENQIFLESVRELSREKDVFFIHSALVPVMAGAGEQKTKPVQQSVRMLREIGIFPNMIFCRSKDELKEKIKEKISSFCGVDKDFVISGPDVKNIYQIPLNLEKQTTAEKILGKLDLYPKTNGLKEWKNYVSNIDNPKEKIKIAMTGKYMELRDSYTSIEESFMHCSGELGIDVEIKWIETTDIEQGKKNLVEELSDVQGILVPGGFGERGVEGKIQCIKYARENNIPFLGLCYGMQLAVVEFARNVSGLKDANTTEINSNTNNPVIAEMPEQKNIENLGGTMRLGSYPAILKENSKVASLYDKKEVSERHRHRYEVNNKYIENLENSGLIFSGKSPDGNLMEYIEIPNHKFFIGTQGHPEFTSRPLAPNPLFLGFVKACSKNSENSE